MKIQLLLADEEVELTKDVSIPLNKTYNNLYNPTDIIVDYSKTVSIPMTITNNRVLGNAFRLDRTIIESAGNANIGIYLDPTKKIPFMLLYNGQEVMEGYAKFASTYYSASNKTYNLNLFSTLGGYFLKLKDVVTSVNKLTDAQKEEEDNGLKYVLNDHIGGTALSPQYVYDSWMNSSNNTNDFTDASIKDVDIIGFAPAYRGYYGRGFKSSEIQVNANTILSLSQLLTNEWKEKYSQLTFNSSYDDLSDSNKTTVDDYVDALGASDVVEDGMKDFQMDEYRIHHLRPYLYINKLFYMFQEKSEELCGYKLLLDDSWFNSYNPYWTKMVYMLNYLEDVDEIPEASQTSTGATFPITLNMYNIEGYWGNGSTTMSFVPNSNIYSYKTFINIINEYNNKTYKYTCERLTVAEQAAVTIDITFSCGSTSIEHKYWSSMGMVLCNPNTSIYNDDNRIYLWKNEKDYNGTIPEKLQSNYFNNIASSFTVPSGLEDEEWKMTVTVNWYSPKSNLFRIITKEGSYSIPIEYKDVNNGWVTSNVSTQSVSKMNYIKLGLDLLYLEEEPIFDVVLQYTKMYGLMWSLDEINKEITICRKSTYFKDYEIEDWTNKLDKSKDYEIGPVSFSSKYVNFNYEEVDGYKYNAYKDKYGVTYGDKKMKTGYDFDSEDEDLYSGVAPSMVSQRQFIKFSDLKEWNLYSKIIPQNDIIPRIEAENDDKSSCINNRGWYFRQGTADYLNGMYLTADSNYMKEQDTPCWYTKEYLDDIYYNSSDDEGIVKKCYSIPIFHLVSDPIKQPLGCVFNCPNEDYTVDKYISNASGNYIFDLFWKEYIDERYNVQNKKLTAYFFISPWEYMNFTFKKFVTMDNQLFMVNKIFDYDINNYQSTKCELVQVSDISAYTSDTISFSSDTSALEEYTLTINPTPSNAVVLINNTKGTKYTASKGSELSYSVSATGYVTKTGTQVMNGDITLDVELEKESSEVTYSITINPIPNTATVTINGEVTTSLILPAWSEATYTVELDGYQTVTNTVTMNQNHTINVNLIKEGIESCTLTINTTPPDATIVIDTQTVVSGEAFTTTPGTTLTYRITRTDYVDIQDSVLVTEDTVLDIVMVEKGSGEYTLTINPTPSNATVKMKIGDTEITGEGTQSYTGTGGETINWSVSCPNYTHTSGSVVLQRDITSDITLDKLDIISSPESLSASTASGTQSFTVSSSTLSLNANKVVLIEEENTMKGSGRINISQSNSNSIYIAFSWNFTTNGTYKGNIYVCDSLQSNDGMANEQLDYIVIPIEVNVTDLSDKPLDVTIDSAKMNYDDYSVYYDITVDGEEVTYNKVEVALSADMEGDSVTEIEIVAENGDTAFTYSGEIYNGTGNVPYLLLYIDDILYDVKEIDGIIL